MGRFGGVERTLPAEALLGWGPLSLGWGRRPPVFLLSSRTLCWMQ